MIIIWEYASSWNSRLQLNFTYHIYTSVQYNAQPMHSLGFDSLQKERFRVKEKTLLYCMEMWSVKSRNIRENKTNRLQQGVSDSNVNLHWIYYTSLIVFFNIMWDFPMQQPNRCWRRSMIIRSGTAFLSKLCLSWWLFYLLGNLKNP